MGTNARTTTTTTRDSARERAYASAAASGSAQPQQAAAGGTGDGRSAKDFYAAVASAVAAHRGTHADEVLTTSLARRVSHAQDEGASKIHADGMGLPGAVVFPETTEEVSIILRMCNEARVPVIPYGVGTSLEGHITPLDGGTGAPTGSEGAHASPAIPPLSLNMRAMNRILEVNAEDADCLVEAGVTRLELNNHLRDTGHFFSVDPGADATLGGMAACRASGTSAVKYGTMREVVMAVKAVLADGTVASCGGIRGRSRKRSNGYDLPALLVGSEGTLGVITELRVRLYPIPSNVSVATCSFETMEDAVTSVTETMMLGLPVARIELMDEAQVHAINHYCKMAMPEKPTLFYEFHTDSEDVAAATEAIARDNGGAGFEYATEPEERTRLWHARHNAYYAARSIRTGDRIQSFPTDVCVPISELAGSILDTKRDLEENGIIAPIVGHVGDGNYHCLCIVNIDDEDEVRRWQGVVSRMVMRAIDVGGTCSGEHGIGLGKLKYLRHEHGDGAVDAMHAIKRALDPNNILNPGKIGSMIPRL